MTEMPTRKCPASSAGPATLAEESIVRHVLGPTLQRIDKALGKEGAGLDLSVDEESRTVVATLVRHRITCEGCLLPEDLVQTMIRKALRSDRGTRARNYSIETKNWLS